MGGALFGGGAGGALGGYGNTNEGKIIAAALLENYNQIVGVVRGDPTLQRSVGSLREEAAAGGKTTAGAVFEEGDVLVPKIGKVVIVSQPRDGAKVVGNLVRGEEVVVIGKQENGYVNVQGTSVSGWVKVVLVQRP